MDPSFEDYVAMSGAAAALGYQAMLATYRLTPDQWTQISARWNARLPTSPQYAQYGFLVEQEAARLRAGGAPRPLTWGAPSFDRQVDQGLNQLGSALASFGSAVGGAIDGTLGTFTPGARVFVQWSDGNRYPATVVSSQSGQVQVAFPDGRHMWIPAHAVSYG